VGRNAILDDDGKPLTARSHAEFGAVEFQPQCLDVGAVPVRQHQNLVPDPAMLTPGVHHEHIVHGRARDGVHTLGLDLICHLNKTW
jgi:hypothetical protein